VSLPPDILAGLARRLNERAGLELPAWVIASRARARMRSVGLAPAAYLELISAGRGAAELAELVEAVRVGETRFFRHQSQIDALVQVVAPAIAARGRRPVRVWSAGCASGEEAYTLALVLARALPDQPLTVVATDVSEDALRVASRGRYPRAALRHVPEAWRAGFEDVAAGVPLADGDDDDELRDDDVRVVPDIARRVSFAQANLVDGEAPRGCTVVWCRNVLIYFAPEARRRAVARLVGALEPGGWLFVGYSEQLRDVPELEPVRAADATIYMRRSGGAAANANTASPRRTPALGVPARVTPLGTPVPTPSSSGATPAAASAGRLAAVAAAPQVERVARTLVAEGDCAGLGSAIGEALAGSGLERLEVDLDRAEFVPDEIATTLRRARAAAEAAGVVLILRATRAGTRRWLRRHGLEAP
jgi:chemotaxis protein methyltransferase CheR